jgi:hypothetical protein
LILGLASIGTASAVPFTWNPAAAGLAGASAFSGDALKATEVSHIQFTGPTSWQEHGYAKITGILNGGVVSVPTGLNSSYTLYIDFGGTGDLALGQFFTATLTLYGVNGASSFGIDGSNNAYVDNGIHTAVALATSNLILGTTGGAPGGDLSAELWTSFTPTLAAGSMFQAPTPIREFYGHFFHPISEPGGIVPVADGIVLNGGDDTLSFVPEPVSLLLFAGGLPGLILFRRRKV